MSEPTPPGRSLADNYSDFELGFYVSAVMFSMAYFGATLITDALLGRSGLPISPLLWSIVALPLGIGLVHYEKAAQARPDWDTVKNVWYTGGVGLITLPPLALALLVPMPVLTNLPRGGPSALLLGAGVLIVTAIVFAGKKRDTD